MKRVLLSLAVPFLLYGNIAVPQDLAFILDKHFSTMGQDKLSGVKTIVLKGNTIQQGVQTDFTIYRKRPSMFRQDNEIQGMSSVTAYDGSAGWYQNPWAEQNKPQVLKGSSLQNVMDKSCIDSDLLGWEEKGFKADFAGIVRQDGREVYEIKLIRESGQEQCYYIDKQDYTLVRIITVWNSPGMESEYEARFSDYRLTDGILMAFRIEYRHNGELHSLLQIDEVQLDIPLDDLLFLMPEE
ncbi:MAG: hypothetical protein JW861_14355 [Bacteroidales bacterium]|nr:hypothetical protein [Bacteroidales bacterium]